MHNGKNLFPWTINSLQTLKIQNKKIALLSNSPRLVLDSQDHLKSKGLKPDLYDFLMTSGQMCHDFLKNASFKRAFFIGPEHEKNILNTLEIDCVYDVNRADFLLVTGLDGRPLNAYDDCLSQAKKRDLTLVCSNPDLGAQFGENYILSAGSLAKKYEENGGKVIYFGKPYPLIYENLFEKISKNMVDFKNYRTLIVGDSLLTDIKGAKNFNIDSALVLSGITKIDDVKGDYLPNYIFQDILI